MHKARQLIGQQFLRLVHVGGVAHVNRVDLLDGHTGEKLQAILHLTIVYVAPVLEELVRACFFGVQPDCSFFGLTHFFAFARCQKRERHAVHIAVITSAVQLHAADDIAPLVISAELHFAAVLPRQVQKIIALHQHIVEFQERDAFFHTCFDALGGEHLVDREMHADLPQKIHIVQAEKPVGIVRHDGLALGKIDEFAHLFFKFVRVVLDLFLGEHFAHVCFACGVTHHRGTSAQQDNGAMPRLLHVAHDDKLHEMAHVQAVRRRVKAGIESDFFFAQQLSNGCFVGGLRDKTALFEKIEYVFHGTSSCVLRQKTYKKALCQNKFGRGRISAVPPLFTGPSRMPASVCPVTHCALTGAPGKAY